MSRTRPFLRVDLDPTLSRRLSALVDRYTKGQGSFNWDEDKHPREPDGEFAPKDSGQENQSRDNTSGQSQSGGQDVQATTEKAGQRQGLDLNLEDFADLEIDELKDELGDFRERAVDAIAISIRSAWSQMAEKLAKSVGFPMTAKEARSFVDDVLGDSADEQAEEFGWDGVDYIEEGAGDDGEDVWDGESAQEDFRYTLDGIAEDFKGDDDRRYVGERLEEHISETIYARMKKALG